MKVRARARAAVSAAVMTTGVLLLSGALAGCNLTLTKVEKPQTSAGSTQQPASTPAVPPASAGASWRVFTAPDNSLSFEVPQDWTVKVVPAPQDKAMHLEVRSSEGDVVATLNTHIQGLGGACQPESSRPYTVLASIPMDIPSTNNAANSVEPRYVYRAIQGDTHFYASYGITDHAAGSDGTACLVYNTVTSENLGIYSFGDVLQFSSDPSGSPGLRAFVTIAEAQAYMESSEYADIQTMITSLKALP